MDLDDIGMQLVTGDLPFSGHTITNLCRHVSARKPQDQCHIESSSWVRRHTQPPARPYSLSANDVVHLGNNSYSVPLAIALQNSTRVPVVVLHDLWLFDLVEAWGLARGISNLALRILTKEMGVRAGRTAQLFRSQVAVDPEDVAKIAACLITALLRPETHILVHRNSPFIQETLALSRFSHITQAPLPLHFASMEPLPITRPALWDIAVVGPSSLARRIPVISEALAILSEERAIRVVAVGGTDPDNKWCHLAPGSTISAVKGASDSEWAQVLTSTKVGVRLGVGQLGESSGLVRDYLMFGMNVVTDDGEPPIKNQPAVVNIDVDADAAQVASALAIALQAPDPIPTTSDELGLDEYSSTLHHVMKPSRAGTGDFNRD